MRPPFRGISRAIKFAAQVGCWLLLAAALQGAPAYKDEAFCQLFRQTQGWAAGDGAMSIPLADSRVLWLFGDSYIDQFDPATGTLPCLFNARNAVTLQTNKSVLRWTTLRNPDGSRSFFHPPELHHGEAWPCFWPGAGFQIGQTLYIFQFEMQKTPQGGALGFTNVAQYWVRLSLPDLKILGYSRLPPMNGIGFWCGFVKDDSSGWTYAFGNKAHGLASDIYVARFPCNQPENSWHFWDGAQWTEESTRAAVIAQGASYSAHLCEVRGKFLLTSTAFSVGCDQGKDIYVSVSDRPTGPFSPRRRIFTVDDTVDGHHPFFYMAQAHPEFINADDALLITYCINGYEPCLPNCVEGRMNPDYYRPRAIRLPLKFIGPFNAKESLHAGH